MRVGNSDDVMVLLGREEGCVPDLGGGFWRCIYFGLWDAVVWMSWLMDI